MKETTAQYSKKRRIYNQVKGVVTNPYNVIVLIAIVLLSYLIVLPLLDMISTTFTLAQRDARVAGGATSEFTLYYWHRLLASEMTKQLLLQPLLNSLLIGVCVSVLAILIGSVLAWLMVRSDLPFKKFFSLAVITSVVKHLPFASRAGTSNMLQIGGELEEAAEIAGAGFFKRFASIVFPLSKGGFISGFMLIFVSIMKELDLIILIMTPSTTILPYLAFQYQNGNSSQASNCVAIVMFSIVFLVYALANIFGDADLAKSMGG